MSTVPLSGKYISKIEAAGISPACLYAWIVKYVPANKFQLVFCPKDNFPDKKQRKSIQTIAASRVTQIFFSTSENKEKHKQADPLLHFNF